MPSGARLTRFVPKPRRYLGYTAMDWFKFYGFLALAWLYLTYILSTDLALFDDIHSKPLAYQEFVAWFTGTALLFVLPAVLGFCWWAGGALVKYTRWQLRQPLLWRIFWVVVLLFFGVIFIDPLDAIHPQMSRKGMVPMPNLMLMFEGREWWAKVQARKWEELLFQFQLGYFLLWFLFCFLIAVAHWQYLLDGLREAWFYINRFHRYGSSVLTGFRETARTMTLPPATIDYPRQPVVLPQSFRGVPRLNVEQLTELQAQAIITADESGSVVCAPGQATVLFIDLGRYEYSPVLAALVTDDGRPLLTFDAANPPPAATRDQLLVPLHRPSEQAGNGAASINGLGIEPLGAAETGGGAC